MSILHYIPPRKDFQRPSFHPVSIGTCSFRIRSFGKGRRAARGDGWPPLGRSPPGSPRSSCSERSIWLIRPDGSARISPSPSRIISPRRIDPRKGGPQNDCFSRGRRGPLPAAPLSGMAPFRRVGALRLVAEGRGRPGGAGVGDASGGGSREEHLEAGGGTLLPKR